MPANFLQYITVFIGRAVLAVPGHATWGGIIGYFAARRRFDGRGPGLLGGYLIAVALHGTYDAILFSAPVAIAGGHQWVGLGVAGVPIVVYVVPAAIIALGAVTLRVLAKRAIAADDADESIAHRERLAAGVGMGGFAQPPYAVPPGHYPPAPYAPPPVGPAPPAGPAPPRGRTVVATHEPAPPRGRTVVATHDPAPPRGQTVIAPRDSE
jgi:hypothetical protein